MDVCTELYHDDEVDRWGFRVPALAINGSGDTHDEAAEPARQAIADVLRGDEAEFDPRTEDVVLHLERTPA